MIKNTSKHHIRNDDPGGEIQKRVGVNKIGGRGRRYSAQIVLNIANRR